MTGVLGRDVRRKQMPLSCAICSTSLSAQTASLGYRTVSGNHAHHGQVFQAHL